MSTLTRRGAIRHVAPVAGAVALTACGISGTGKSAGGGTAIGGEIEFATTAGGSGLEWENAILKQFTQRYPAAKPTLLTLGSTPATTLTAMTAGGTPPDIVQLNNDHTAAC